MRPGPDGIGYLGASDGVIFIPLKKPHSFSVSFKLRHNFEGVYLSPEDPDGFMAALRSRKT